MGCRTYSLLAAALVVFSLSHRLPVSCARHVKVLKVNHGLNNRGDTNLANEPASGSTNDFSVKIGIEGRKLRVRNMKEDETMGVKGDQKEKADVSHPKPLQGSQTEQEQQGLAGSAAAARRGGPASSAAAAGSRPRMVEMRAAGKHADPVTEMYDMLRRDYTSRASRRRPINNGEPLHYEEP